MSGEQCSELSVHQPVSAPSDLLRRHDERPIGAFLEDGWHA